MPQRLDSLDLVLKVLVLSAVLPHGLPQRLVTEKVLKADVLEVAVVEERIVLRLACILLGESQKQSCRILIDEVNEEIVEIVAAGGVFMFYEQNH